MFFIPGWLISSLTFPGVVMHEIAHRIFCHLTGVPVYDVRYFAPMKNPSGYVDHGHPPTLRAAFLISAGPLIINSLLCMLLTFSAIIPLMILKDGAPSGVSVFLLWIGISIGMHAFPSNHDARSFAELVHERRGKGLVWVLATLFSWVLTVVNALRVVWIDAIYAVVLAMVLPAALGLL